MGQGGGNASEGMVPEGFIVTDCGPYPNVKDRYPAIQYDCGCHTTPWGKDDAHGGWTRRWNTCPVHAWQRFMHFVQVCEATDRYIEAALRQLGVETTVSPAEA